MKKSYYLNASKSKEVFSMYGVREKNSYNHFQRWLSLCAFLFVFISFSTSLSAQSSLDTDGDGIPNSIDVDDDNDGILDEIEACPTGVGLGLGVDTGGTGETGTGGVNACGNAPRHIVIIVDQGSAAKSKSINTAAANLVYSQIGSGNTVSLIGTDDGRIDRTNEHVIGVEFPRGGTANTAAFAQWFAASASRTTKGMGFWTTGFNYASELDLKECDEVIVLGVGDRAYGKTTSYNKKLTIDYRSILSEWRNDGVHLFALGVDGVTYFNHLKGSFSTRRFVSVAAEFYFGVNRQVTNYTTDYYNSSYDRSPDGVGLADDASRLGTFLANTREPCTTDFDNDGIPNTLDTDSDGDGCPDANEYYNLATVPGITNVGSPTVDGQGRVIGISYSGSFLNVFNSSISTSCPSIDTDGDGRFDFEDLDDDNDGVTDVVENSVGGGDTDGDGVPNRIDLDSDNDGIDDVVEAGGVDNNGDGFADGSIGTTPTTLGIPASAGTGLNPPDTDGDSIVDHSDLDSDDDGLSDLVESGDPILADANNDGVVDGPDTDGDGIRDSADGIPAFGDALQASPIDQDADGLPNFRDPDSDDPNNILGDNNDDIDEGGNSPLDGNGDGKIDTPVDVDGDGIKDPVDDLIPVFGGLSAPDSDNDGVPDAQDLDDDNDGITDVVENLTAENGGDTDGDGVPDQLDLDADNDGINDVDEAGGVDNNNDGIADGPAGTTPTTNGIPSSAGTGLNPPNTDATGNPDFQDLDSDDDAISDLVENGAPNTPDADDNGVVDGPDTDGDGIKDPVDGSPIFGDAGQPTPVDADNDGLPNFQDPDSDDPTNTLGDNNDDIDDSGNGPLDGNGDGKIDSPVDVDNDGIKDPVDGDIPVFGGLAAPEGKDSDGDGVPDANDLDDDNDGIPDVTENATASNGGDTDDDGIPDTLDLDSDNDGINDVVEANGIDPNGDGIAEGPVGTLVNTNGIPASAGTGLNPPNTDNDGQPDFQDLDSDNDTVSDLIEGGSNAPDANDDGIADGPDADQDGIVDAADGNDNAFGDQNDPAPTDTDNEGTPNYVDPDSDDPTDNTVDNTDGVADDIDDAGNTPLDADQDGLVDNPTDQDDDGIADVVDDIPLIGGGLGAPAQDTDGDGIPNYEDLDDDNDGITDVVENATASNGGDTDGDGIPDQLDLDSDNDGINDVIEAGGLSDLPFTGSDIDFVSLISDFDQNDDGIADGPVGTDGIPESVGTGITPLNTDNDGQPDFQDLDSDNDTVSDLVEGGSNAPDVDDNGVADGPDADQDGIVDAADGNDNMFGDRNAPLPPNTDNDGLPNFQDPDSDDPTNTLGDGNDDIDAGGNGPLDANNDGQIDNPTDVDNDGIADVVDGQIPVFGGLDAPAAIVTDLFPNFTFGNTTYNEGDSRFVVININEIEGGATNGQIQFFVPSSAGFIYTFDQGLSNVTVLAPESVNNSDWTVSNTGTGLLFTSNVSIAADSRSRIALNVTADKPGTKANVTVNIVPTSGGETNANNNIAVLAQSVQN